MADPFADLLDAIVRDYVITDAQKDVDLNAPADEAASMIEAEKRHIVAEASAAGAATAALVSEGAHPRLRGAGHRQVRDSASTIGMPEQNAIADALIMYLVRFDLAESRSEETEPGHYDYFISVNWDAALPGRRAARGSICPRRWPGPPRFRVADGGPQAATPIRPSDDAASPKTGTEAAAADRRRQRGAAGAGAAFPLSGPRSAADRADPSLDPARGRQRGDFGGANTATLTNERLEFLGDAVLGAVAAEYLYNLDPLADEGQLTRRRVALVRAETLVRWAREIDLGSYLYLGLGERPGPGTRDRMLAGAFEAVIGAVALDRGFGAARKFLMRLLERDAPEILAQRRGRWPTRKAGSRSCCRTATGGRRTIRRCRPKGPITPGRSSSRRHSMSASWGGASGHRSGKRSKPRPRPRCPPWPRTRRRAVDHRPSSCDPEPYGAGSTVRCRPRRIDPWIRARAA